MSETEAQTEETAEATETTQPSDAPENDGESDFLTDTEKDVLQEWLIYVTGLFAAFGLAIGLNGVIQDVWAHDLVSYSGQGTFQQAIYSAGVHASNVWAFMILGIVGVSALGIMYARNVDNENQTAFKVAAATGIVALPVLLVVGTFLYTLQLDNWDPEFVNLIVSGIGAGIAAAIGSAIVVWLTENKAPAALN